MHVICMFKCEGRNFEDVHPVTTFSTFHGISSSSIIVSIFGLAQGSLRTHRLTRHKASTVTVSNPPYIVFVSHDSLGLVVLWCTFHRGGHQHLACSAGVFWVGESLLIGSLRWSRHLWFYDGGVTKCCIYNQFSVVLILHSIKAYFFTCSYFRILYSVLHLKDSSTSIRVKIRWSRLNPYTWSAARLRTTTQF